MAVTVQFFGATEEVTGSCYLVRDGDLSFLVDCGMYQGSKFADERNHEKFPFDPRTIDAMFVTHAHMDHNQRRRQPSH